jgi:D-glycero-alpha-D-manno-heptose-7-phosphate kinase
MIITRTPLRISLGGGGTDLPSYYSKFGGFVISAAIDKYIYITINRTFFPGYLLKYSEIEHAHTYDEIRHPFFRELLRLNKIEQNVEIVSVADVPAGTGLGSSGSFLVGLSHALHAHKHQPVSAEFLACEAIDVEMVRLKEPIGKQDQYVAAYGGLICQEYNSDGSVVITPLRITQSTLWELRDSLMMFFVGYTRSAVDLLSEQKQRSEQGDRQMLEGLDFVKQLGQEIKIALEAGDVGQFGAMMHEHWLRKRSRSKGMSSNRIDELYELARTKAGVTGGKLVGAGGSGFLLFHTNDRRRLRAIMTEAGVHEMDFAFDFDGSVVMLRSG